VEFFLENSTCQIYIALLHSERYEKCSGRPGQSFYSLNKTQKHATLATYSQEQYDQFGGRSRIAIKKMMRRKQASTMAQRADTEES